MCSLPTAVFISYWPLLCNADNYFSTVRFWLFCLILQGSLKVLNVSGNNLDSISDLECLNQLTHFLAIDNQLNDMKELACVLSLWYNLSRLDLMGNPLCHKAKYRDRVIVMGKKLGKYFALYWCALYIL